jgi:phosphatidylserine/phosphatidylglycerophosphate/cardiolipin synthase-like enzyme
MSHSIICRIALGFLLLGSCSPAGAGPAVQPVVNQEYLPVLLDLIAAATNSIEFLQLEYHDDRTSLRLDAALAGAVKRGVKVRGLLDDGVDFNAAAVARLLALGVEAKLDASGKMTHSKLVVVDGKVVLLGSTNWTGNSMDNNNETNLRLDDPALAGLFGRYVAALWADSFAEPELPSVESGTMKTIVNRQYFPEVLGLLNGATQRIRVVMYGIKYDPKYAGSKVNQLVEALAAARGRGVDVAVAIDLSDYNVTLNEVNAAAKEYLAAAGVAVYDDAEKITTHAKVILADDRVLIGSANWGYDAIERRNETCVVVHDPQIAACFLDYFARPAVSATPFEGGAGGD